MNVFIVPSCIKSLVGTISYSERFEQTIKTFESVRRQVNDAIIIFCDSSLGGLYEEQKNLISERVDYFLDYSQDQTAMQINEKGLKSIGESYLLGNSIIFAKNNLNLNQNGRMFKLGGRCELLNEFTMDDYKKADGKFVFKKRLQSWRMPGAYLLETRLYSWNLDMTDEYLSILNKNLELLNQGDDTEHAHFLNVPSDKLMEFDVLNVGAMIAGYTSSYYIKD